MPGKNATPLVGWHPSAGLVAWLDAETKRRGGGRGVRSAILEEALATYRDILETETPDPASPTAPA
jgi:hypothetical protein